MTGNDPNNPVDKYLRQLPSEHPDAALGNAILDRHLQRRWRRLHVPPLAAAALLAVCIISLPHRETPVAGPAPAAAPSLAPAGSGWVELRSIDRRLQQAYLSGGTAAAEIDQLWSRRELARHQLEHAGDIRRVQL